MTKKITYQTRESIAVIGLNNPPVNSLGHESRTQLSEALQCALVDPQITAIVIISDNQVFSAGADINEFGTALTWQHPSLPELLEQVDQSNKLIIAAVEGVALGGGLELAMACDYRISDINSKLGLPEVKLGLIPGAGGTQRLPRLTNVPFALDMIISGTPVSAQQAYKEGLVDKLSEGSLIDNSLDYVRQLLNDGAKSRRCTDLSVDTSSLPDRYFDDYRTRIARKKRGYFAPEQCIHAVEAACTLPFKAGLEKENTLFLKCLETPQARAQQHIFFAEREATRVPGIDPATKPRQIRSVAVIGAGTMGGGIAMAFISAGIPVKLLELEQKNLDRGLADIDKSYDISVKKGRFSQQYVNKCMALLSGTLNYDDLADVDLVIEAVFESMEVKQTVFEQLDRICKPGAILASNTSTLDINTIASFTKRPEDVVGMHFFSPANIMRLLEIIRGNKTSADVIVTAIKLARVIKKVPVVVGVCFGFVGNRMLEPYAREAHRLLLEGATPRQVDSVLTEFGLAMGPLSMYDLAGIDVGYLVRESRRDEIAHDPTYNRIADDLYHLGRFGQKTDRGFYFYNGREQTDDAEVTVLARKLATELGIQQRIISDQEIFERCLFMLINEGADILNEGIAYRSGDCDLIWVNGYGFPAWRGGPMQYADEVGLNTILEGIEKYRSALGSYGEMWFKPSPLLVELVASKKTFSQYKNINPEK